MSVHKSKAKHFHQARPPATSCLTMHGGRTQSVLCSCNGVMPAALQPEEACQHANDQKQKQILS